MVVREGSGPGMTLALGLNILQNKEVIFFFLKSCQPL